MKSVQVRSFFWSAFPCIQYKYRKTWIRKKYVFGHFPCSAMDDYLWLPHIAKRVYKWTHQWHHELNMNNVHRIICLTNPLLCKWRKFYLISWCRNFVEKQSFHRILGDFPETLRKLWHSTKFPHQEIRRNFGI